MPLSATTYYVDCNGGDSNNGTSTSTPWQTISRVNKSSFLPGDSVLFKAECTWREQLTVPSSGTAGNPITFGAYGTGPAPIISGADLLTSWTTEGGLYYSSASTQPNQIFLDGQRLTAVSAKSSLVTGASWWDSTNNRVYVYDNPSGHIIEASERDYAIYSGATNYVTLANIQTQMAQVFGLYYNGYQTSGNLTVIGVTSLYNYDSGLRFNICANCSIIQSAAAYNGDNGVDAWSTPGLLVDKNTVHDNCQLTAVDWSAGIKLEPGTSTTNCTISNNSSYANGLGQPDWRGAGIWLDTVGTGCVVKYNRVYSNNLMGIYLDANSGDIIEYNVSYGNGQDSAIDGGGIAVYGDARPTASNLIYGNTVYGNRLHGIFVQGSHISSSCQNNVVKNNISVDTVSGPNFAASGGCENDGTFGSGNVYTYNAFGPETTNLLQWGASNYSTYSLWEAAGGNCGSTGCSHSVQADPAFKNAAGGDFTLLSTSPAIDAGTNLGSTYQFSLDPRTSFPWGTLNQNSQGSGWEIGAFVFVQQTPPAPPPSLSATVE